MSRPRTSPILAVTSAASILFSVTPSTTTGPASAAAAAAAAAQVTRLECRLGEGVPALGQCWFGRYWGVTLVDASSSTAR
ncbi:hypothetical protein OHA25_59980 (plasmid) [Nonomuraea sp. NBC_00507]|uniref:hypothetical protein n=1 Tax=Nonomuraea sp. NBC_00507 TaxID=2976002 RepID=UPI002E18119A